MSNTESLLSEELFSQFGANASFIRELYSHYRSDPSSVGEPWTEFFRELEGTYLTQTATGASFSLPEAVTLELVKKQAEVSRLIDLYRSNGHFKAKINPLSQGIVTRSEKEELQLESHGLGAADLDTPFFTEGLLTEGTASLSEIVSKLQDTYANTVGFEYMHLTEQAEREFLRLKIERDGKPSYPVTTKKFLLKAISDAAELEALLHKRFVGAKRFSVEGGETASAMIQMGLSKLAEFGAEKVRIGMAHRGRLTTVVNICGKPIQELVCEFEDNTYATVHGSGDVKYHLGAATRFQGLGGVSIDVALTQNPSHLEFVNAVVEGQVRADQDHQYGGDRTKAVPFLIHGDAAFAGQGVVFETLNFVGTKGYDCGGTVHLVINNQVGFTATEDESRGTTYCTDLAKGINAPVFHVHGEDVEACAWTMELAAEFRQKFGRDVIVDLICYRKYGHNEGDDPTFTQPLMYNEIKAKAPIAQQYVEKLQATGVDLTSDLTEYQQLYRDAFEAASTAAKDLKDVNKIDLQTFEAPSTTVKKEVLLEVADALCSVPTNFAAHQKLFNLLKKRSQNVAAGEGIEWGVAEGLAFGSLLIEGVPIRVSGQDACRGTFSHRHSVLDSIETLETYTPLNGLKQKYPSAGTYEAYNSVLSECGVMGFEYGYANVQPKALTIWEAQFGDFSNGAQVMIDQYLSAGEIKWGMRSGLVLMLPHGFEGQGPEHSSARLERYLQLCAEDNIFVYMPTNGAQLFHILRRHALSSTKRPVVIMTPKSLLRLPDAATKLSDFTDSQFQPVIAECIGDEKKAKQTFILSGKIYYEVSQALKAAKKSARLIRVEQFYPNPVTELKKALKGSTVTWVQEEPKNQGAWTFMADLLREELNCTVSYIGRPKRASTACGSNKRHQVEQREIIEAVVAAA
jgi:2-oxoglutarate dehydrogenase E1 component